MTAPVIGKTVGVRVQGIEEKEKGATIRKSKGIKIKNKRNKNKKNV